MGIAVFMFKPQVDLFHAHAEREGYMDHFDVVAPSIEAEQWKNASGRASCQCLQAALGVLKRKRHKAAGKFVEEAARDAAAKRLAVQAIEAIQPARANGDIGTAAQDRFQGDNLPDSLVQIGIAEKYDFPLRQADATTDGETLPAVRDVKYPQPAE